MKSRAAVLWEAPGDWDVIEAGVDEPKEFEVSVRFHHAGLCHSDDHYATGNVPAIVYPFRGGHVIDF